MKIAVITDDGLKAEWTSAGVQDAVWIEWLNHPMAVKDAGCIIDLMFYPDAERISLLQQLSAGSGGQPALIIVNSVVTTLGDLPGNFIRINGWPGFLQRTVVESSCPDEGFKDRAEKIFAEFNKTAEWVPDGPGFITARIISMIINEAYFALGENVSGKKEIDIAMKLGTNYPFGPFEWSERIGLKKIEDLLKTLSRDNPRYEPAPLLIKEASLL